MSNTKYDLLIFIGRMQPFHLGHKRVIDLALKKTNKLLILVGSSFQAPTIKNPFMFEEREHMIRSSLDPQQISKIVIRPLRDYLYCENKWLEAVQNLVDIEVDNLSNILNKRKSEVTIGIIGHEKDDSSYYVNCFPTWGFVEVGCNYIDKIDATMIRETWFSGQSPRFFESVVPSYVYEYMTKWFNSAEFQRLCREYEHIKNYKKQWEHVPYPVTFNTVDAVIIQAGHVLLIKRKASPGEGLYAVPGGFINANETIEDSLIREIYEETSIKVPEPALRGSIKGTKTFDAVGRSLRGRTITHAFLIELNPEHKLAKIKAADDAASARWVPLVEFNKMENMMFEDHFHIVNYFIGNR